ncbi:endolysin [Erwinia phage Ea9-2]|uniref:Lytic transglycosylase n=1 Tax=Erwinia phage Ea9-2 TaxID=1429767 RepID=W6ARN7_9CAUD|nr:endolysin [Erwinia phage Ea9-2]AHI60141.1 lytic transglycosylase [Erwinia phage Ea9-2]
MPAVNKKAVGGIGGVAAAIIAAVFAVEGGYVNDPKDPGGETNHGITKQVAQQNGYTGAMKDLTMEMAGSIYYKDYIEKPGFVPMIDVSPNVTWKLVDAGVNTGTARPSRWFQTGLNSLSRGGKDYPQINVDGKVGSGTIAAYKSLQKLRGKVKACELMLKSLDGQQLGYYMSLTNLSQYTVGWIDNRIGNVPYSNCQQEK